MDKLDIITIGESLIEFSSEESLSKANVLHKYYGGDTINTAITAARLGSKIGFITRVGNDPFKEFLLDSWQIEGLDISNVKIMDGSNGIYFISRPKDEPKEDVLYSRKSSGKSLSVEDINESYIKRGQIIYSTGRTQGLSYSVREAIRKAFQIAKQNETMVAYDPNYRQKQWSENEAREAMDEILEYTDIIFLNSKNDGERILGISSHEKLIKYFWDKGVSIVAVKMGKDGCAVGYNGNIAAMPCCMQDAVDSTGAGDTFNGAFLHGITSGYTPFEAMKLARVAACLQSQKIGSIKSIPDKKTLYEELNKE